MAAYDPTGVITDPDDLSATVKLTTETRGPGDEVFIDTVTRTIQLYADYPTNSLKSDGVTLKALYSFLKDRWLADADLIKFPFPMTPITDEQFEFYNGWNLDKTTTSGASQTTPQLIRTGGWAVKGYNTSTQVNSSNDSERWASVITLGTLGTTDQVYYQQVDVDNTATSINNFVLTNTVNQAIQFYRDDNDDGDTSDANEYNYSGVVKLFCREWQKTYAASNLTDIGVTQLSYQAYRFPLTNSADSKIDNLDVSETAASGVSLSITTATWAGGSATLTSNGHGFIVGDEIVVSGVTPSGYNTSTYFTVSAATTNTFSYSLASDPGAYSSGGSVSGYIYNNMNISWFTTGTQFTGFNDPPGTAYFKVVIDADVDNSFTNNPTAEQIYAWTQAQLRRSVNVNSSSTVTGSKIGKIVPAKLQFVGDDLYSLGQTSLYEGVYINDYNDADANRLHFWGYGSSSTNSLVIGSISRASSSTSVTTIGSHGFSTNDYVTVSGVTGGTTDFNGNYKVTVTGNTTFTYSQAGPNEAGTTSTSAIVKAAEYTNITFPFTAILRLNFGDNLVSDASSIYRVFFTNDNAGDNTGRDFGTKDAILVNKKGGGTMSGFVSGTNFVSLSYDYDGNDQRGITSKQTVAPVTAVAIGLATAQYVVATGNIDRSVNNSISLVAPLERNYQP